MSAEPTTIALEDVRVAVRDGSSTLVEGVELSLRAGEIVGVVGETGAGKTLTTRAALGLLPSGLQASGTLRVGAEAIDLARPDDARSRLGRQITCVLQNPLTMLDPLQRVERQLTEGVRMTDQLSKADARERAAALLARMGFRDPEQVLRLYPHQLSGGMAQRVAIAIGLMPRAELLVLDEPTSALDAHTRIDVLELLREAAAEQGTGVILVSHDLGLVQRFCDRLLVMYAGLVVEQGAAADVVAAPQHPYTMALLASSALLDAAPREHLPSIPGAPPPPAERPAGCPFQARCPHAFERCSEERPALGAEPGSRAACHLAPALSRDAEGELRVAR